MQALQVITVSPRALDWLENFQHARILNLFQNVINLIDQGNHILSIVNFSVGNGPFSMVLDSEKFSANVCKTDNILKNEHGLNVGDLQISLNNFHRWDPKPDWNALQKQNLVSFIPKIEDRLLEADVRDGFIEVFYKGSGPDQTKFYETLKSHSESLLDAMRQQNEGEIIRKAGSLGGLGPGLTPSGDDFLVGVIYALWSLLPEEEALSIAKLIWAGAAGQTTSLSRAWLSAAAAGEVGEPWHNLIDAVIVQNEQKLSMAISEIISTGATSGADALCGFVQAMRILEKR